MGGTRSMQGELRNANKISVGKPRGEISFSKHIWPFDKSNVRMCDRLNWIMKGSNSD
jgi:hypothetical protein